MYIYRCLVRQVFLCSLSYHAPCRISMEGIERCLIRRWALKLFKKNSHAIWWKDVRGFGFGFPSGFLVPKQKCKDQVRKAEKGKR